MQDTRPFTNALKRRVCLIRIQSSRIRDEMRHRLAVADDDDFFATLHAIHVLLASDARIEPMTESSG